MALLEKKVGRRNFLKGSAAAAAALAAAGIAGCAPNGKSGDELSDTGEGGSAHVVASDIDILEERGQWVPMCCNENCGGGCVNRGYLVDGVIVRQATDDTHEDTDGRPQQRSCPRGRSLRQQLYNADRLKYPMKRKSWQPGGGENSHGELRGKDEWERVSWDDALDLIAGELKRVYADYGPQAVMCNSWRWQPASNLLRAMGGAIMESNTESFGTWVFKPQCLGLNVVWGDHADLATVNDRYDMRNAEYIVFLGANTVWCNGITPNYYFKLAQEAGAKFVYINTSRNASVAAFDGRWIPARPGTDTALLLAVMYEMMRLDEERGDIIDWDFLNTYCVGFDLDHMPEDAELNECISEYVKGVYDGIPKTPEWASEICGTPVEDITFLAEIMGKNNKTMFLHSYAASRVNGAENLPQAFLTVGAMGGHMGKSGHACGASYSFDTADSGPWLYEYADVRGNTRLPDPYENNCIEGPMWWKSVLDGKYVSTCVTGHRENTESALTFHKAKEMPLDPHILFGFGQNFAQTRQDLNDFLKAIKVFDMVVACDIKSTLTVQYADFALPALTAWECNDDPDDGPVDWPLYRNGDKLSRRDLIRANWPCVKPVGEARSDVWILRALTEKVGLNVEDVFPYEFKTTFFDNLVGCQFLDKDGVTYKRLLTWTAEDSEKWGVDNPPQEGEMTLEEFIHAGCYVIEREPGDNYSFIGYKDYVDDPVANPRPSRSGKLELYCQLKADNFNVMEINPEPIKPYANYIVPIDGYEASFADWENKVKGEYPIQMYNHHYLRRSHTSFDNSAWLQEAFVNPVFINADDAAERGIADGDTVLVRSAYGKTVRNACVLSSIMPGTAALPHGAHSVIDDSDPDDVIDLGGNEQILYGPVQSNYFPHLGGYNSLLVELEKYDGEPLQEDYERDPFILGDEA
ncbi:molybdopterin-dependent oxidoreductase [Adlercreutzia sp. R25]|uniref:Molybdopterin-dependent oxidoreductase n=1 Tax=Adlercreutzia shanghongiae TaxID=3111773 RepID=A0ABU6IY97_9ACTN|nr:MULTISPECIES: molybdopterin-dependent oxidoreductase [unclassified Adlercreutzia]MEC4271818.1 molybdopterin-dependent oxidoreductase [Adlercreutzia sp. R25]MEC4294825.1 molybdopterin-dependent oxidoreductase [Adlercreutzia sp. R22]